MTQFEHHVCPPQEHFRTVSTAVVSTRALQPLQRNLCPVGLPLCNQGLDHGQNQVCAIFCREFRSCRAAWCIAGEQFRRLCQERHKFPQSGMATEMAKCGPRQRRKETLVANQCCSGAAVIASLNSAAALMSPMKNLAIMYLHQRQRQWQGRAGCQCDGHARGWVGYRQ